MTILTEKRKNAIDKASYEQLLSRWRFGASDSEWFQGDTGDYYRKVMFEKKQTVDHVAISKKLGW